MSKKISIAIDAMGGDNAPDKTIEGIKFFLEKNKEFEQIYDYFSVFFNFCFELPLDNMIEEAIKFKY